MSKQFERPKSSDIDEIADGAKKCLMKEEEGGINEMGNSKPNFGEIIFDKTNCNNSK